MISNGSAILSAPGRVHDHIGQTGSVRSLGKQALVGLFQTADLARHTVSDEVEKEGITLQQYNVLRILREAGPDGLPTLTIADRMLERTPGVTRIIDRLEAKALTTRKRCRHDRRQVICTVTDAGQRILSKLDPAMERMDGESMGDLSYTDMETLVDLLDRIREAHVSA